MLELKRLGKYEIRDILGHGAMGTVYRAFDPDIERMVALKTIRLELVAHDRSAEFRSRFRNEAIAAGRLHHPNIVGIYEYGEDQGNAFIAMEYVDGTDLSEYANFGADVDFDRAIALTAQLLAALDFAHGCGVIHRDIKPSNLLVTRDGVVKVADFGIARVDSSHLTATGAVMGTPSYMSPEQCQGREVDLRSDLFSVGVVLYELLTGGKPFGGPPESISYRICHEEPLPPSRRTAHPLPPGMDAVMAKALAKEPRLRFSSAVAFGRALSDVARFATHPGDGTGTTCVLAPVVTTAPTEARHASRHNLPLPVTAFIGREIELAEVRQRLRSARLLTLIGVGGLGKTRLAVQAARASVDAYPDGVWLVELAALDDGQRVALATAKAMSIDEEPGCAIIDTLARTCAERRMLLILDNCEHLLHACAELARRMLQAGSGITILASSREPLRIAGEVTYPVPPLGVPPPGESFTPESLLRFESVRLFVERASAALPTFQIDPVNAGVVAGICRRLDGIPLALELAAARVRAMSVETIAARLDDRFRLLKGGDQTALPRQQTLRAMIDWSYDLLTEPQRQLLHRLAVFSGGFAIDAAEAVGGGGEIDAFDVLELLGDLVEKSLVVRESSGQRYRLLETIRQYAGERLAASGEESVVRTRHLEFFLALAQTADPALSGPEQGRWYDLLDRERENLLVAHAWCDHATDGAQHGLQLLQAMRIWLIRGALSMGHGLAVHALARPGAQLRNLERAHGLFVAGVLDYYMGHYVDARTYAEECLAVAREIGDQPKTADALSLLGAACSGQGDRDIAHRYLTEGLALARGLGDDLRLIQSLSALAELLAAEGKLGEAELLHRELLGNYRAMDDPDGITATMVNLARIGIASGAGERAASMLRDALATGEAAGSHREGHQLLAVGATFAAFRADWERAARYFGAAEAKLLELGFKREPADAVFLAPWIDRARGAMPAPDFAIAEAAGRALEHEAALAELRAWLAGEP